MLNYGAEIRDLPGPVFVLGAGGFIGANLLLRIRECRRDVYGVSQNPKTSWRLTETRIPEANLLRCDITDYTQLRSLIHDIEPKTILNLSAYGGYSRQREYKKIYATNLNATIDLIEIAKNYKIESYVHAGSSSEYGTNSEAPNEDSELCPNSHYAVSKVASSYIVKYYGTVEKLPVANLRIYSAYGPWEEPDRLIPTLVAASRNGGFPPLVNGSISRDFVYVDDVCAAFILTAHKIRSVSGRSLNIGTGTKTTIHELAMLTKKIFGIRSNPSFGSMTDRQWDMANWYSDPRTARSAIGWQPTVSLVDGLKIVSKWQEDVDYDNAYWNYRRTA